MLPSLCQCCCCYWRADSKTSALNKVVQLKRVFDGFPNLCCPERWFWKNRISHPDWVKLCVDPNGRIKLCAKQKCEILSATDLKMGKKHTNKYAKLFEGEWKLHFKSSSKKFEKPWTKSSRWKLNFSKFRSFLVRILIRNDNTDNKVFKKLLYIDPRLSRQSRDVPV